MLLDVLRIEVGQGWQLLDEVCAIARFEMGTFPDCFADGDMMDEKVTFDLVADGFSPDGQEALGAGCLECISPWDPTPLAYLCISGLLRKATR